MSQTNIRLPLPIPEGFPTETLDRMRAEMEDKLLHEWDCFAAVFVHDRKWWTRCSAQVYNDVSEKFLQEYILLILIPHNQLVDFDHLAKALKAISEEMSKKFVG